LILADTGKAQPVPHFVGEFEQTIDDKHRLSISAALRDLMDSEADGTSFFLVLGKGGHLWLYPDRYYKKLMTKMKRSSLPVAEREKIDLWYAMARLVRPDSQGRVVLPEKSMQRAVIDKDVTLVGNGDHIEIWPTAEHEKRLPSDWSGLDELLDAAADEISESE